MMPAAQPLDVGTDRRERLQMVANRVHPVTLAREQTLPVPPPLASLFPEGRLRRGITISLRGSGATSTACTLIGPATAAGSWVAIVGDRAREVGLAAAAELGVAIERVAVVAAPDDLLAPTLAALLGAFDVVLVTASGRLRASDARRLMARARERGTVIAAVSTPWPEAPDIELALQPGSWCGIGLGHGHLRGRAVHIATTGRRDLSRPRQVTITLPLDVELPDDPPEIGAPPYLKVSYG